MTIEEFFGQGGALAQTLPAFEARPGQLQMAQLIERGFLENAHTIVEAGTGVGKSMAYLIPAIRSKRKVVISTGTIALQEQLMRKDIPMAIAATGIPARAELLKGRNHYLCRAKYERAVGERLVASSAYGTGPNKRRLATVPSSSSFRAPTIGNRSTPMPMIASVNFASASARAGSSCGAMRRATPISSS
jgi:Rad3-related DNA helicase